MFTNLLHFAAMLFRPEFSYFRSRHEVHNRGDQGFSRCFVVALEIDTEALVAEVRCEGAAQIAEGVFQCAWRWHSAGSVLSPSVRH